MNRTMRRLGMGALALVGAVGSGNLALSAWVWHELDMHPMPAKGVPPTPLTSLSATSCQPCHPTQYEQWASSRMGRAMKDPVFLQDWEHQGQLVLCKSCHAPLTEQHQRVPVGLWTVKPLWVIERSNAAYVDGLEEEGVTCVVCHLHDGAMHGPKEVRAPHPTVYDPDFGSVERCERCHQDEKPPLSNLDRPLADTVREWVRWKEVTGRGETCVDCHMPGGDHTWKGAWDAEMLKRGLDVSVRREGEDVVVSLHNLAGHRQPSTEPGRALVVRVGSDEQVLARRVPLPRYIEMGDDTLGPDEVRELRFAAADGEVVVEMQPIRLLAHGATRQAVEIVHLPAP